MTERWVCTTCGKPREVGDAVPPLKTGLVTKFATGKCAKEKGHPWRTFRRVDTLVEAVRDLEEGERRKAEGQARADNGWAQRDGWTGRFDAALIRLAHTHRNFTSEDVTAEVGMPTSGSPSVVGSRMTAAAKRGIIVKTGRRVKAQRPNQHAAELTEWRGVL